MKQGDEGQLAGLGKGHCLARYVTHIPSDYPIRLLEPRLCGFAILFSFPILFYPSRNVFGVLDNHMLRRWVFRYRAGALSFKPKEVLLSASRWMMVYGRLMLAMLGLMGFQAYHLASRQSTVTLLLIAKLVELAAIFVGMGWFIQRIYIRPWLIQRRTQVYQRKP
ncbi:hypothetical protein [Dyella japonica]|uniref:DUF418 domain-containing protein n=1 Tax=Dyella japonica TaxID=231455 RepID=A0ABV2K2V9_9GAMM